MDILSGMEFDHFVPSFPELQNQFNLSDFWVEALLSVNFAGYCLSLFFVGGLADHYGRKPIILLGLMTFIIGTLLCLWASSYQFLLVSRFLQGVGIATPAILSFLIIADAYPLKKQQSLFAILNGLFNFAADAAPVLGSYSSPIILPGLRHLRKKLQKLRKLWERIVLLFITLGLQLCQV